MILRKLSINNYKSLRSVNFQPGPLACIVGPNASGKSNFADSMHFLSEVYQHGLELAIARKGGYENIAFRRARRTKGEISFDLDVSLSSDEVGPYITGYPRRRGSRGGRVMRIQHRFRLAASRETIRADFHIVGEYFEIQDVVRDRSGIEVPLATIRVTRDASHSVTVDQDGDDTSPIVEDAVISRKYLEAPDAARLVRPQDLCLNVFPFAGPPAWAFARAASNLHVFRLSPRSCRATGVPTPNPELSQTGENLPALVDWLQRRHQHQWETVVSGMRDVLTGLQDISTQYLHTKTLGLFFREEGFGRPWGADEVSDGTIQTLAMLVAAADPRAALLVVEEPENSIHPWVLRAIVNHYRRVSSTKTVILTSHSPVLIDLLQPKELWVASRCDGETSIRNLPEIDPAIVESWEAGKHRLSTFLDAGLVPQAVPGGVG